MNVFFYLDKRRQVLTVVSVLTVLNLVFSLYSQKLGAVFYGYGFALAVLLSLVLGLVLMERKLGRLEYETFMLQ